MGLQEPQTTGYGNLSWEKSSVTQRDPSSAGSVLSWGQGCSGAVVRDTAFPDCHSEPSAPPRQGLGNIKATLRGPLS